MSGSFGGRRGGRREPRAGRQAGDGSSHDPGEPPDPQDPPADPASVARTIALDLLTAMPRTRAQLAAAMARKGVPDDVALEVLDRFTEVGLINDAEFAQMWVRSRQSTQKLAPRALAVELRKRGVDEPTIAEAVNEIDRDDIEDAARALVRRKARASVGLPTQTRVRRLSGMLARKGYSSDVIMRVVRETLAEENVDVADDLGAELAEHIAADSR